jgi:hypothetical protein
VYLASRNVLRAQGSLTVGAAVAAHACSPLRRCCTGGCVELFLPLWPCRAVRGLVCVHCMHRAWTADCLQNAGQRTRSCTSAASTASSGPACASCTTSPKCTLPSSRTTVSSAGASASAMFAWNLQPIITGALVPLVLPLSLSLTMSGPWQGATHPSAFVKPHLAHFTRNTM